MQWIAVLLLSFPLLAWPQGENAMQAELRKLAWQQGPAEGRIADKATIQVPQGYVFLDAQSTRRFLELAGNPPRDGHYVFAPVSLAWFSVFSFNASGYVKDDEKIHPDSLLKILKESDKAANDERRRMNMDDIYTLGWEVPPHYDGDTRRLEWGVKLKTGRGEELVNYTSRLLGRTGVMNAVLVTDLGTIAGDIQEFKAGLREFNYVSGERYTEFKPGDKIAEYGLAALVVGGAAAAPKSDLLESLGKFLWLIIAAGVALLWACIKRLFGRKLHARKSGSEPDF